MKWFHNLKIKAKMILSFSIVIALLAALAVFSSLQMSAVDNQNTYASQYPGGREVAILDFQSATRELRRVVATMTMYAPLNDETRITPLVDEATAAYNDCIAALNDYDYLTANDPVFTQEEKDTRLAKSSMLRDIINRYNAETRRVVELSALRGEYEAAVEAVILGAGLIGEMGDTTTEMLTAAIRSADEAITAATATSDQASLFIVIVAVVAALISVVIALYIAGFISKPLTLLSAFMEKAGSTGDITLSPEDVVNIGKHASYKDELGHAISGSASFVKHVTSIAEELKSVADGDLTVKIEVLSDSDTLGVSLKKMSSSLNNMFGEIQTSADQVSLGSKQVAEGAQALAQGSTEQAASIQELSGSISEIAEQTKTNAETAEKTSKLSAAIKDNAVKGSRQMDQMISAVDEINDASRSISKIIKTIDDIAFQTNILALNAAVEAARAGQHGKGFAVVAEEVRNLASKSAEAAKDTGNMIQNSMEKAELGSRIAGDTAISLKEIVSGINESSQLIEEIARASEEQSVGISQINTGIEQVAHVIQQNSATAEESAAASQEMSSQSDTLQQLISQFKLDDRSDRLRALPPVDWSAAESYAASTTSKYGVGEHHASEQKKSAKPYVLPKESVRGTRDYRKSS